MLIADDADITVMLVHYISREGGLNNLYLQRQGKLYNLVTLVPNLDKKLRDSILLSYVYTGCDTVSGIFRRGKTKLLKSDLSALTGVFYSANADCESIICAGEQVMKEVYGQKPTNNSLDEIRYSMYCSKLVGNQHTSPDLGGMFPSFSKSISHNTGYAWERLGANKLWVGKAGGELVSASYIENG